MSTNPTARQLVDSEHKFRMSVGNAIEAAVEEGVSYDAIVGLLERLQFGFLLCSDPVLFPIIEKARKEKPSKGR